MARRCCWVVAPPPSLLGLFIKAMSALLPSTWGENTCVLILFSCSCSCSRSFSSFLLWVVESFDGCLHEIANLRKEQ